MIIRSLTVLLFIFLLSNIWGQRIRIPNLSGTYTTQSYPFFNPASIKLSANKGNILVSHKQGIGAFSVFSQNYFNVNFCFGADSVKKHAFGLRVLNDQAGKYIGITRTSFLYRYLIPVFHQYRLKLGIAPTLINYRKEAQNFGGSAIKANFDVGIWFSSKTLEFGAALNQIIKNELVVIEEVSIINRQYVLNFKYGHSVHPLVRLDYQLFYKINNDLFNEEVIAITVNYSQYYRCSINYEHRGNVYLLIGLKEFSAPKITGKFSLDLIYGVSGTSETSKSKNVIELMLNYDF